MISDDGEYLYPLLIFQLSSVSTSRGNIGVCRRPELILVAVRLFVISLPFNWPPIRRGPSPSLSGVIKPNHLGHYSQQGHPSVDREVMKKRQVSPFFILSMKKFLWSCDCFQIDHN